MNRRVAAHKDRKGASTEPEVQADSMASASSRAAAAAERVAARYANAPTYSEMLANEARAAVRAAEAASKAALEAQAAAEQVLAGLEAASAADPSRKFQPQEAEIERRQANEGAETDRLETGRHGTFSAGQETREPSGQESGKGTEREGFEIRWEPGLPARSADIASVRATHGTEVAETALDEWREPTWPARDGPGVEAIGTVEPAQPIHANLIEFPREIVATRKVRPRLAEGPLGESGGQLSIFEVDPDSISTEPLMAGAAGAASAPAWSGPEWSGIELDAQPRQDFLDEVAEETQTIQARDAADGARGLALAPIHLRLMAAVVNGSLVMLAGLVSFLAMAVTAKNALPLRELEVVVVLGLGLISVLYHSLFYAIAKGTPGMWYAHISLCTFEGKSPTRAQRFSRLGAMVLSLLPVGLGVVWAMFDEDHLSWHDRWSQTYLKKR